MSDTGGTPAATPAAPAGTDGAAAAPPTGPRRAAPGLSHERSGLSLTQGLAQLRRGAAPAAPAATPAATAAEATPQPRVPVNRSSPNAAAAAAAAAGDDGPPAPRQPQQRQPAQPQPQRQATAEPASPLDAIMAHFLPPADGADPQHTGSEAQPQPAPVNTYLQGVPLTIGNEQRVFSVPELTEAVSKASDYTNKTRQLAEQARAVNERAQTIDQLLPILMPEIERQLAALNGDDNEPDWNTIPPDQHPQYFAAWRTRQRHVDGERARLAQIQQANAQREAQQRLERVRVSHAQLVRTIPGWGDEKTRTQLVAEMRQYGLENGFPAAELDSIVEARHVETLLWAMIGKRNVAAARTMTLQVPQVRRGGAPPPPGPAAQRSAQERFNANPNTKTGVGLLMANRGWGKSNGAAR